MLECYFAEIEDISVVLPDGARRTLASRISSPDSPILQYCYIIIARTMRRAEACSLQGSVACCRFIVLSWQWQAPEGHLLAAPSVRTAVPAIKDAYFLFANEKLIFLLERGGWDGNCTQKLNVL